MSPFQSDKQERYLFKFHPDIAKRWADEAKSFVVKPNLRIKVADQMKRKRRKDA